jgi:uncharacterized protein YbjQ (UPF0145 family)
MTKPKILLIGAYRDLGRDLPNLFSRAGFEVDAIALRGAFFKNSKFLTNCFEAECFADLMPEIVKTNLEQYFLVVPFDDVTLKNILESELSLEKKLKLLPVLREEDFLHLSSKINLSKILRQGKISTPQFAVAKNRSQALSAAEEIGFPLMLKVDFSRGGAGVFECHNLADIAKIEERFFLLPTLLQKKIEGVEIDLSAFYQEGKLIHFCYAIFEKTVSNLGPSSLRTYKQLAQNCDEELFQEMQNLGKVLGANGFVNISAILSKTDGKIYFFEADMRPNVWVDFIKFIGDDLALRIRDWFEKKQVMQFPFELNRNFSSSILMPHFLRLLPSEILFNRHKVWKLMSAEDWCWFLRVIIFQSLSREIKFLPKKLRNLTRNQRRMVQGWF